MLNREFNKLVLIGTEDNVDVFCCKKILDALNIETSYIERKNKENNKVRILTITQKDFLMILEKVTGRERECQNLNVQIN